VAPPAEVAVTPAGLCGYGEVRRLMPPYLRELAALCGAPPIAGTPRYPGLAGYWLRPGRHAFVIEADGASAGFALVNRWSPSGRGVDRAMAEFYITPAHRRRGVGRAAAGRIFAAHAGIWEVSVLTANTAALQFWRSTAAACARGGVEEIMSNGTRWQGPILRFTSR
jgi:predicted acetyltransferase